MLSIEEVARRYAINKHKNVNHLYGDKPYSYHLDMVNEIILEFIYLIPEQDRRYVIAGGWSHDLIEDTRVTYNDVKQMLGEKVADLSYVLTNEKGKTRKERANKKYYREIRRTKYATFIKLCDRIANIKNNINNGGNMLQIYKNENKNFIKSLKKRWWEKIFYKEPDYTAMFIHLENLVK